MRRQTESRMASQSIRWWKHFTEIFLENMSTHIRFPASPSTPTTIWTRRMYYKLHIYQRMECDYLFLYLCKIMSIQCLIMKCGFSLFVDFLLQKKVLTSRTPSTTYLKVSMLVIVSGISDTLTPILHNSQQKCCQRQATHGTRLTFYYFIVYKDFFIFDSIYEMVSNYL